MSKSPGTVNDVQLASAGNISGVSVYSDRAEVSRTYLFTVAAGQNRVVVGGLPYTMDHTSVRVEGRGDATIHDVTISLPTSAPPSTSASPGLQALSDQREEITTTLSRYRKALTRLDRYLEARTEHYSSGGAPHAIPDDVAPLIESYVAAAGKYDEKVSELKKELRRIDKAITEEHAASHEPIGVGASHPYQATIGIYADEEGEVELILKYVVIGAASWKPLYEIRANTESKDSPIEIIYKAAIKQDSGEDWTDVLITLETAKPTFGLSLPNLPTWNLSVYTPPPPPPPPPSAPSAPYGALIAQPTGYSSLLQQIQGVGSRRLGDDGEEETAKESAVHARYAQRPRAPPPPPARRGIPMQVSSASVDPVGLGMNPTFKVPGLITIPSDGVAHNVTIAKLKPEAKLSWLAVPQVGAGVYLTARFENTSEYTLLAGPSTVYLDRSFVAKSTIPLISPQRSFTCALGLDPSIRLTTSPPTSSTSTSGILTKTTCTSYTQRISVHNAKNAKIEDLRVLVRIPVSLDEKITVKLLEPSLPKASSGAQASTTVGPSASSSLIKELSEKRAIQNVEVAEGVTAQWSSGDGSDFTGPEEGAGGQEGRIQWNCVVDAKAKVNLTLRWEVASGKDVVVVGL